MEYLNVELDFLKFKNIKNISICIYEYLDFSVIFALRPSYVNDNDISIKDIVKLNNILFKYKWKVNIYEGLYGRFVELKRLEELIPPVFNNIKELHTQASLKLKTHLNFLILDDIEDGPVLSQNEIHIFFHRITEYGNAIPDLIRPAYERLAKRINDQKLYEYSNNRLKEENIGEKQMEKNFIEPGTVVYVPVQISEACISKDGKFTYTLESRFFPGPMSKTEEGRDFYRLEDISNDIKDADLYIELCRRYSTKNILKIIVTENTTNGDMIKILYPDGEVIEKEGIDTVTIKANGRSLHFYKDWWYAKYKNDNLKEESKDNNDELLDPYDMKYIRGDSSSGVCIVASNYEESKKDNESVSKHDSHAEYWENQSDIKEMIYNGFSQHDCESHYKCPVCDIDYGSWKMLKFGKTFRCNCGTLLKTPK